LPSAHNIRFAARLRDLVAIGSKSLISSRRRSTITKQRSVRPMKPNS